MFTEDKKKSHIPKAENFFMFLRKVFCLKGTDFNQILILIFPFIFFSQMTSQPKIS